MSPAHVVRKFLPLVISSILATAATSTAEPPRSAKSSWSRASLASPCAISPRTEKVSVEELVGRGNFAMQAGQYAEAIAAFERVLKSDRNFSEAWGKLAFLYLKQGRSSAAVEAFRKAKLQSDANGGIVTRGATGGPMFP